MLRFCRFNIRYECMISMENNEDVWTWYLGFLKTTNRKEILYVVVWTYVCNVQLKMYVEVFKAVYFFTTVMKSWQHIKIGEGRERIQCWWKTWISLRTKMVTKKWSYNTFNTWFRSLTIQLHTGYYFNTLIFKYHQLDVFYSAVFTSIKL